MRYDFEAEIWRSSGASGWFFATLPIEVAEGLRALHGPRAGFGSLRVRAHLAGVNWDTSVFPDARSGSFLLPLKAQVRERTGVTAGDRAAIRIDLAI
ncbi:DUF1905 domain-containing protein [Caulobacter vibrioides]|uniref:DUF1905 domain-containing protein n=2 Tax=Caulobacter vibrioides TaxID=155892 RepID=Q9A5B3_CAUVC|nr:DUF1905 domain-containing protein [Caulobacter vibrioides]YP_002517993.1 DUF1905 domain-containing protein [Caulobacter vibrioides NA1000]AAK24508.1 hypothetical protein CC_2537 [Caulobacter vibrioides CB15]ACL96085.1 DUF1905 domain-containing protein [Caulobacter vibrioides NA1000]ATC29387.1 DUF1905 domain-containing protein [Caulobacter vibrioides]QXZ50899.1 DUF1905 domain-containing protein [Caulobacter vibrioides]